MRRNEIVLIPYPVAYQTCKLLPGHGRQYGRRPRSQAENNPDLRQGKEARYVDKRCNTLLRGPALNHRLNSGFLDILTGGGPSVSGYGSGAPGGGLGKDEVGGGDKGGPVVRSAGLEPSSKGVFGGRGGG